MEKATPVDEKALLKRWVETWKFAGSELDRLKRQELRAMTEEDALRRLFRVMDSRTGDRWRRPDRIQGSGMIEQQRLFAKFARVTT